MSNTQCVILQEAGLLERGRTLAPFAATPATAIGWEATPSEAPASAGLAASSGEGSGGAAASGAGAAGAAAAAGSAAGLAGSSGAGRQRAGSRVYCCTAVVCTQVSSTMAPLGLPQGTHTAARLSTGTATPKRAT